jgi:NAD(P)-dependent dehydrogenase (short-subunit alcohol dehydrogenase family)
VGPRRRHSLRPPRGIRIDATRRTCSTRTRQLPRTRPDEAARVRGIRPVGSPHQPSPDPVWEQSRLSSTFLTLKHFLPSMLQRGQGSVVTMATSAARLPGLGAPALRRRQGGRGHAYRQVAGEAARHRVRVNSLVPHTVLTEQIQQRRQPSGCRRWPRRSCSGSWALLEVSRRPRSSSRLTVPTANRRHP